MDDRSKDKRNLTVLTVVFALYALFGWIVLLFGLLVLGPFAILIVPLVFTIPLAFSIALASPVKAWAKSLPVQYVIGVGVLLLQWNAEPYWGGSLLTLGGYISVDVWLKCLLYCVEITAIQALGMGIRLLCRKLKKKYGDIPF